MARAMKINMELDTWKDRHNWQTQIILGLLQAVLNILDRLSDFCTGLLTLVLAGFWIHHCILGNRDNVILLSISLAVCMGIPVLLQTAGHLIRRLSDAIS